MYLSTEKEVGEKGRQVLAEEEAKTNELKAFINNLMRQKETAIKSDLERSETIIAL